MIAEVPAGRWNGRVCIMCDETGVYPYRPRSGKVVWAQCAACNKHGREPK